MSLLRTFIALDIPSHLQQLILKKTEPLRNALGASLVRWVAAEHLHLTLKFLGDVSPANVESLTQLLRSEAELVRAFEMQVHGLGAFPELQHEGGVGVPAIMKANLG